MQKEINEVDMKKKVVLLIITIILLAGAVYYFIHKKEKTTEVQYEFTTIKRGNIENLVSCTGTLETVGAVEVGTELSGTVTKVYADFNDNVKKNQILAILDTTQLSITLRNARAELIKAEAQYELSKTEYENDQKLYEKNYISEIELKTSETNMKSSYVGFLSAEASVDKAELNINKYSIIRSPMDGKVINRDIEEGQTVAASLSTPTLFTIAKDLSQMEIYAYVDESDIGKIDAGMKAKFTVEAYSDEEFEGVVKQVRLQPETISNVVNYTVVVEAPNRQDLLLPGMTATIDFIVEQKEDVLVVSNAALSFNPDPFLFGKEMAKDRIPPQKLDSVADSTLTQPPQHKGGMSPEEMMNAPKLWYLDDNGNLKMTLIKTGSTDDINTELSDCGHLQEGSQVIKKSTSGKSATTTDSRSNNGGGPGGRPMMGPF